jgi:hypothetical protein
MRRLSAIVLPLLSAFVLACADKTPAKFKYDAPPPYVASTSTFSLNASVLNKKDETIGGLAPAYSAAPADVLEVSSDGNLRCARTGDATLTLSAGGLSQPVALKCRIPTEINVPPELQLVIGAAPSVLHPRVLGEGGTSMDDVKVDLASSDPSIFTVEGDAAKGVAVGKARLQASLGGLTSVTPVEVVEKVVSEPLTLRDGASRSFPLQPATYLVTIELKTDARLKQGVAVSWTGTACDNQPEASTHRFNCRVEEPATMTVTNPKLMGVGATVTGTVNVFRVPG